MIKNMRRALLKHKIFTIVTKGKVISSSENLKLNIKDIIRRDCLDMLDVKMLQNVNFST